MFVAMPPGWHVTSGPAAIYWCPDRSVSGDFRLEMENVPAVEAAADVVRFFVNGVEVANLPRSELGVEGTFGFRVNHGLNLHISRLEVRPLG